MSLLISFTPRVIALSLLKQFKLGVIGPDVLRPSSGARTRAEKIGVQHMTIFFA